jgi:hypothetical protein
MDARLSCAEATHPDELDEELDMFPTLSPNAVVRLPYDRLRSVDGREGASGSCRSSPPPIWAVWLAIGLYVLRHPRFRGRMPSDASNFSKRLPSRSDTNDVAYCSSLPLCDCIGVQQQYWNFPRQVPNIDHINPIAFAFTENSTNKLIFQHTNRSITQTENRIPILCTIVNAITIQIILGSMKRRQKLNADHI